MKQRVYIDISVIGDTFIIFLNMETKIKKSFDTVTFFRAIKEKLADKMAGMNLEQQKEFRQKVRDGKIKIA